MNISLLALSCLFCLLSMGVSSVLAEDMIFINKHLRTLSLFRDDRLLLQYSISIGLNTLTDKAYLQDYATPEGNYKILYKKNSKLYGWFLGISYPNEADAWLAFFYGRIDEKTLKRIVKAVENKRFPPQDTALGGALGIHGGSVFRKDENGTARDWTRGCVALNDEDMVTLYKVVKIGAAVRIFDSSKGFYVQMRPFVQPEMELPAPTPLEYWSGVLSVVTDVGRVQLRLREDRQMARTLEIRMFDEHGRLFLRISDTNADERLDDLDVVACSDEKDCDDLLKRLGVSIQAPNWETVYSRLRSEIIRAYFRY